MLAITTGMREGELLALRWDDIDFENDCLHVRHTPTTDEDYRLVLTEPKTERARRVVSLGTEAISALCAQRSKNDAKREEVPGWNPGDLVFTTTTGTAINPSNLLPRHFYPFLKRAGLPRVTFHQLRHSYATHAVAAEIPINAISQLLGHRDTATTMRIYAHATPEAVAAAPDRFSALLAVS